MLRLGLRVTLFCLPLLAGWAVLECWMAMVPSSHSVKREHLQSLAGEIDTLVLGSSSANWDIVPQYLPGSAFNLANVAQSLYYDDQLLTRVAPTLPKLKRVIIVVSYISLFYQIHGTPEEARQYYYYQEWSIPPQRWRDRLDIRMWSAVVLRTPAFAVDSLRSALMRRIRGGGFTAPALDYPIDARGWSAAPADQQSVPTVAAIERKLSYHHDLMHLANERANLDSLEHMLGLMRARDVDVVVITTPVWPGYLAGMRTEYRQRTRADLDALCVKYQARCLSFLSTPALQPQDFLDEDHLNERGAVRFTELLSTALQRPRAE
jgi:hypothetical protein